MDVSTLPDVMNTAKDWVVGVRDWVKLALETKDLLKRKRIFNPVENDDQPLKIKDHLIPIEGLPGFYMKVNPHLIIDFNSVLRDMSDEAMGINLLYWTIDNVVTDKDGNKVEDINSLEDVKELGFRECNIIMTSAHQLLGKQNYKPDLEVQIYTWLLTKGISPEQIKSIPDDVYNYLFLRYKHTTIGFEAEARDKYRILTYIKSSVLATGGIKNYDEMLDLLPEEEPFLTFYEEQIEANNETKRSRKETGHQPQKEEPYMVDLLKISKEAPPTPTSIEGVHIKSIPIGRLIEFQKMVTNSEDFSKIADRVQDFLNEFFCDENGNNIPQLENPDEFRKLDLGIIKQFFVEIGSHIKSPIS